jgi:putative transposase
MKPLLPTAKFGGRPRTTDEREVLNGVFYVLKSGCDWRMLPHDLPHDQTVYEYFSAWKKDGTWKKVHDTLRHKLRLKPGEKKQPTAGILDSQSVKTTKKGGLVGMMLARR